MPNPLTDKMQMGDIGVKVGLACAKCGEIVQTGKVHRCKETEDEKTNSGKT